MHRPFRGVVAASAAALAVLATGGPTVALAADDTTPPVIIGASDLPPREATSPAGAAVAYPLPSAHDDVDRFVGVTCDPVSGVTFPLGVTTVTCSATDSAGNTGTDSFTITVRDTTPPVLLLPRGRQRAEATGFDGAAVFFTTSAQDAADLSVPVTCDRASGDVFPVGLTEVDCTATDDSGNTVTGGFEVEVTDRQAPLLPPLPDLTVEATGPTGAVVTYVLGVPTDVADPAPELDCPFRPSGSTFPLGDTSVLCIADDRYGNVAMGHFTVSVVDTTAPVVTPPDDVSLEATGPLGAAVPFVSATAVDLVDGPRPASCDRSSGSFFPVGTTTVLCSAADTRSNVGTATFTVTVLDATPPTVTVPAGLMLEATSAAGAVATWSGVSAFDLADGPLPATCDRSPGDTFPLGTTAVTCSATDAAGRTGTASFSVTVRDTTGPVLTVPAGQTLEATGPDGAVATWADVPALDAVDGSLPATCAPASGATFPLGWTSVTCTATDAAGNEGRASFVVAVVDTTAPRVTVPTTVIAEATSATGAEVSFPVSATDVVDGAVPATCDRTSGSRFALGATTVTCSATDRTGNVGTASFTVRVEDASPPVLTLPAPPTAVATSASGARVSYPAPSATDLVDGALPVTCDRASGSLFPLGRTTVTCTATDRVGNTGTGTFTVQVTVSWSGLQRPASAGGETVVQRGSTLPVKFALTGATAPVTTLRATLSYRRLTPTAGPTVAAGAFRYDAASRLYQLNLRTKPMSPGTYELRVDLGDGQVHTAVLTVR